MIILFRTASVSLALRRALRAHERRTFVRRASETLAVRKTMNDYSLP